MSDFVLKLDPQFKKDYQVFKREHHELISEFKVALRELKMNGTVPDSYNPHRLNNRGGLYNGNLDFHLSDGKVDVIVIYTSHKTNHIIRLVRIGTHKDLFQG